MNLAVSLERLEQLCEQPSAVRRFREVILESAIRGRLSDQCTHDQPATELLRTITAARLSESKRYVSSPPPTDAESWFQHPHGWVWTRLGEIGRLFNGDSVSEAGKTELAKVGAGLPFIATKDIGYGSETIAYENGLKVKPGDTRFKVAKANSVLICAEGGSAGRKIALTDRDICFGNKLYANETWNGVDPRFVYYVYQAPSFYRAFVAKMTGIIGGISRSELLSLPIPLPPSTEQKRIVAKVDELMALCDWLEGQLQERDARSSDLSKAALAKFSEEPTIENLEYLFHPAFSITPSDLRKGILSLAVRGKLVPQDSSDHPVDSMLTEIDRDKRRLGDTGALKADKRISLAAAAAPHVVPDAWRWVRLQDVFEVSRGGSPRPAGDARFFGGPIPWITVGEVTKDSSRYLTSTQTGLTEEGAARSRFVNVGDLLLTNSGATLGVPKIAKIRGCINDGVAVLRQFHRFDCNDYAYLYLTQQTDAFRNVNQGMGQPNLNTSIIAGWPLPLPPLVEQRRIVAKVEELMALVDQLEAQLAASEEVGTKLLDALVAELAPSN